MGIAGGDSNGWPPDGGPPEGLPELPAEWGPIVIPDDAAALAEEAAAVRRELRRQHGATRWQLPSRGTGGPRAVGMRLPLAVLALAVLVTLASVVASTWPGRSGPAGTGASTAAPGGTAAEAAGRDLPALELVDAAGGTVALRATLPAVVVLVDGCRCADLVADTAAARPDLAVITVTAGRAAPGYSPPSGGIPPAVRGPGIPVRHLTDPTGELRGGLGLGPSDGTAAVLLVSRAGRIVRLATHTTSVEEFRADLTLL